MSELDAAFKVMEELMEPCEKCGKVARGGRWCVPGDEDGMPICQECWEDRDSFAKWFEAELEKAVIESGEFEQLTDGKWRRKQ